MVPLHHSLSASSLTVLLFHSPECFIPCVWSAADPSFVENPELSDVLPFKPGLCRNIANDASPTRGNFTVLICTFRVHSTSVLGGWSNPRTVSLSVSLCVHIIIFFSLFLLVCVFGFLSQSRNDGLWIGWLGLWF